MDQPWTPHAGIFTGIIPRRSTSHHAEHLPFLLFDNSISPEKSPFELQIVDRHNFVPMRKT